MFRLPSIGQLRGLGQGTVTSAPQAGPSPIDPLVREIGQEQIRKIGECANPPSRGACGQWIDFFGKVYRHFTPFGKNSPAEPFLKEEAEGPIRSSLPNYVLQEVFKKFSDIERCEGRSVCAQWKALLETVPAAIDPQKDPEVTIFGKKSWEARFGLKIDGEIPQIPENIRKIANALRARIKGKGEAPACSLLLMPKGLSLHRLENLAKNPRMGCPARIEDHSGFNNDRFIFELFGNLEIEETYWVLITNEELEGSFGLGYQDQMALMQEIAGPECSAPFLLEALVCGIMNQNRKRGFAKESYLTTYTRVQEADWEGDRVIVGTSGSRPLCLDFDEHDEDAIGIMLCKRV